MKKWRYKRWRRKQERYAELAAALARARATAAKRAWAEAAKAKHDGRRHPQNQPVTTAKTGIRVPGQKVRRPRRRRRQTTWLRELVSDVGLTLAVVNYAFSESLYFFISHLYHEHHRWGMGDPPP